ncbi:MAG TPA: bifunctional precorrin-2 dehydrogenase/sirohydrochlorin ferrochelatase [Chthonomonadaceae bacterium]|nr:bifunctional precorrin-2 dehydrogenase/sirohydrochlorin ferrochelatase [Chthonomonadaceae bacterium]
MPPVYPAFLRVAGRLCVVVGGGRVAQRKAIGLMEAGAIVRIVSAAATARLRELADGGALEWKAERYRPELLDGALLVVAATNDRAVNAQVAADADRLHVLANIVDAPERSGFITARAVRRGELCVGISTGGASPMLAARLAGQIDSQLGPEYGEFVELLGEVRSRVKRMTGDRAVRRAALAAVLDQEPALLASIAAGNRQEALLTAMTAADAVIGTNGRADEP